PETLAAGAQYVRDRVTQTNLADLLGQYVGPGDLLIDLAWNIDANAIIDWCHQNDVLYLNTSVEVWDPYEDAGAVS
ncbi:MAG TPA: saccharopine dehydrogenase NADP-binding domain-containing protein, partial [Anaerolineales bacterium]|nr:saccharopine dehydrogenase NADP-binding domain-containing protein [Anaerolineales bacterium]